MIRRTSVRFYCHICHREYRVFFFLFKILDKKILSYFQSHIENVDWQKNISVQNSACLIIKIIVQQMKKSNPIICTCFFCEHIHRSKRAFSMRFYCACNLFLGRCKYKREITYVIIYIHIKLYFVILI